MSDQMKTDINTCGLTGCGSPAVFDYDLQGYCNGLHQAMADERRSIAQWLIHKPCVGEGHDARWCQTCSYDQDLADAIESGDHRSDT